MSVLAVLDVAACSAYLPCVDCVSVMSNVVTWAGDVLGPEKVCVEVGEVTSSVLIVLCVDSVCCSVVRLGRSVDDSVVVGVPVLRDTVDMIIVMWASLVSVGC